MNNRNVVFSQELNPEKCLTNIPFNVKSIDPDALIDNVTTLTRKLVSMTNNAEHKKKFRANIKLHLAKTYSGCEQLKKYLSIVIEYLEKNPNEKDLIIEKLVEGVANCTPGFHDRVYIVLCAIYEPNTIDQLLAILRRSIVEKIYRQAELEEPTDGEVHTHHRYFILACVIGYAIYGEGTADPHRGIKDDEKIYEELRQGFTRLYSPVGIVELFWDESPIARLGYHGRKTDGSSYEMHAYSRILTLFKTLLSNQNLSMQDCFILDESYRVLDINWLNVNSLLLEYLYKNNYIYAIENPEVYEFEDSGNILRLSHPKNEVDKGRLLWQQKQDDDNTEYHLLLGAGKRIEDFRRIPYPLLRKLLTHLCSLPDLPISILGIAEQLIDVADEELQQVISALILNRITQATFKPLTREVSLPRLRKIYNDNANEVRLKVANIQLDKDLFKLENVEKCAFVASLFAEKLESVFLLNNVSCILLFAQYIDELSPTCGEVICNIVIDKLVACVETQNDVTILFRNLKLNSMRAISKVLAIYIQSLFDSLESILQFINNIKTNLNSRSFEEQSVLDAIIHTMYLMLKPKILSCLENNRHLPLSAQLQSMNEIESKLTPTARSEFISNIKSMLPHLVTDWHSLLMVSKLLKTESEMLDVFQAVKNNQACPLSQQRLPIGMLKAFCYQGGSILAEPFCEVFSANILLSFQGPESLNMREIERNMTDEEFATFCLANKLNIGVLFDSILTELRAGRSYLLISELDSDIRYLVYSPKCISTFSNSYRSCGATFMRSGLKGAGRGKINNLNDLRIWCENVNSPNAADIVHSMISDYFFDHEAPIAGPKEVLQLLNGDNVNLWMVAILLNGLNVADFNKVIADVNKSERIKRLMSNIENITILINALNKLRWSKLLNAIDSINEEGLTYEKIFNLIVGEKNESQQQILEKAKRGLLTVVRDAKSLPKVTNSKKTKADIATEDLMFDTLKEKIAGFVTSLSDLDAIGEVVHYRHRTKIILVCIARIKPLIKAFSDLDKLLRWMTYLQSSNSLTQVLSHISPIEFNFKRDGEKLKWLLVDILRDVLLGSILVTHLNTTLIAAVTDLNVVCDFKKIDSTVLIAIKDKVVSLVTTMADLKKLHESLDIHSFRILIPGLINNAFQWISTWQDLVELKNLFSDDEIVSTLSTACQNPEFLLHKLEINQADYEMLKQANLHRVVAKYFPNQMINCDGFLKESNYSIYISIKWLPEMVTALDTLSRGPMLNIVSFIQRLQECERCLIFTSNYSNITLDNGESLLMFQQKLVNELKLLWANICLTNLIIAEFTNFKKICEYLANRCKVESIVAVLNLILRVLGTMKVKTICADTTALVNDLFLLTRNNRKLYSQIAKLLEQYAIYLDTETFDLPDSKRGRRGSAEFIPAEESSQLTSAFSTSIYSPTLFSTPVATYHTYKDDNDLAVNNLLRSPPHQLTEGFYESSCSLFPSVSDNNTNVDDDNDIWSFLKK